MVKRCKGRMVEGGRAGYLVRVYKHAKIFTICVSVQKVPVARLAKPPKPEFTNRK